MVYRILDGRSCRQRGRTLFKMSRRLTMKCRLFILVTSVILIIYVYQLWKSSRNHTIGLNFDVNLTAELKQHSKYHHSDPGGEHRNFIPSGIASVEKYCNSPFEPTIGNEGKTPNGYSLRMVHVFIRHGDRTSLHNIPEYTSPKLSCHFELWYNGSDELFIQFHLRMLELRNNQWQNGTTFSNWPLYPNKDICSAGSLTSRGCLQHLNLGRHFSRAYLYLIDPKAPFKDQINVQCTSTHRTYQSVIALLYGFVPDFHLSNIVIEHAPSLYFCRIKSWLHSKCFCKHAVELKNGYKRFETVVQSKSKNVTRIYNEIGEIFNLDVSRLPSLSSVADVFAPEVCHDSPNIRHTSDWKHMVDRKLISDIWAEMTQEMLEHLNDAEKQREQYSSIIMLPVLTEIAERIRLLTEQRPTPKIWIYSGHDLTLTSLLFVLGLHDGIWPPYASRVVMEIFENEAGSNMNRFYMRFLYNGRDVTEDVTFCKNVTYLGLCNLRYFDKYVLHTLIQRFGYSSYSDACNK